VAVDSVAPGYTRPLGDWKQLPPGKLVNRWRGENMDLELGIEVLSKRAKNVPAGTSATGTPATPAQRISIEPPSASRALFPDSAGLSPAPAHPASRTAVDR
jgi:hypothetical protein